MMTVRAVEKGTGRVRTGRIGGGSGSGGVSPTFTTNFLALSALPTGISLSRATSGIRFNSSGVPVTEAIDAPRFDYTWNGSLWVPRGLLAEDQWTNLLLQSNTFSNAAWTVAGNTSVAQNATGPDGIANSAWTWNSTGGAGSEEMYQSVGVGAGSVFSVFVKTGSGSPWLGIQAYDGGRRTTYFNSATGTIGTVGDPTGSPTVTQSNAVFTPLANGWYRASVINNTNSTSFFLFWMADVNGGGNTVTGAKSLLMYTAGAGLGQFVTSHVPTTTAAVTRSADLLSSAAPLTAFLAAGPSVWEFEDEATGVIARAAYAAGAFDWPVNKWYRSMGVYPTGTDTSGHMVVGSGY